MTDSHIVFDCLSHVMACISDSHAALLVLGTQTIPMAHALGSVLAKEVFLWFKPLEFISDLK